MVLHERLDHLPPLCKLRARRHFVVLKLQAARYRSRFALRGRFGLSRQRQIALCPRLVASLLRSSLGRSELLGRALGRLALLLLLWDRAEALRFGLGGLGLLLDLDTKRRLGSVFC